MIAGSAEQSNRQLTERLIIGRGRPPEAHTSGEWASGKTGQCHGAASRGPLSGSKAAGPTTGDTTIGGARPGRGAGTSVGSCRCPRMRSTTAGWSMRAINRSRAPSFERAQDGPEPRRRAAAWTREGVEAEAAAHEVGPEPGRRLGPGRRWTGHIRQVVERPRGCGLQRPRPL